MTTPKVGSRDSKGRYWDGKQYVSLEQGMKNYNQSRGYNWFNRPPQQGTSSSIPGIGEIRYDRNYGWQTKSSYEKGMPSSGADAPPVKPRVPALPTSAAQPGTGPQGNQVGSRPAAPEPAPAPAPAAATARTAPPASAAPTRTAPAPTPFGKSVAAPSAADLDKYKINKDWAAANPRLAQAQVSRASGQPRADINKILYKPGTAAYGASGKSEMEKKAEEIRQTRERISKEGITPIKPVKEETMIKEPYDLVLEYLFSQGHVDTLDEAHYVMLQMDGEYIQSIIESPGEWFRGIIPNNSAVENEKTRLPSTIPPLPKPVNGTRPAPGKGGKNRAEVGNQYNVNLVK